VPDAALAGARRLELAGVRLDRGDEVGDGLVRRVGAHLQAGRVGVDEADRRVRRARDLGEALPVHHADLDRDQPDRVAVGSRARDRLVADDTAAAGAVDDVDRLAEVLLEQRADDARGRVGAAAGAPRDDQRHRALGPRRRGVADRADDAERGDREHPDELLALHGSSCGVRPHCADPSPALPAGSP
jgi:hypothetical protein